MPKENKVRVYNRLFFKLYLNYVVMLLMTAVLICLIFIQLYKKTIMTNERVKLMEQAEKSSEMITTKFINTQNYSGFLDYINTQQTTIGSDVWTISNPARIPGHKIGNQLLGGDFDGIMNTWIWSRAPFKI